MCLGGRSLPPAPPPLVDETLNLYHNNVDHHGACVHLLTQSTRFIVNTIDTWQYLMLKTEEGGL